MNEKVFTIFCDNELDLVELKWTSAGVKLTCPVLKLKHASLWSRFLFLYFFPFYHNEFFRFIFPSGLTGYVAALFSGWL